MPDKPDNATTLDWRDIFWREWCHTEDEVLAGKLFGALADEAPSLAARRTVRRAASAVCISWAVSVGGLCALGYWVARAPGALSPLWVLAGTGALGAALGLAEAAVVATVPTWRRLLTEAHGAVTAAGATKARLAALLAALPVAGFAIAGRQSLHPGLAVPAFDLLAAATLAVAWLVAGATAMVHAYPALAHEPVGGILRRALPTFDVTAALLFGSPLPGDPDAPPLPWRILQARAFTWWRGRPSREEFIAACRRPEAPEWAHALVKQVKASDIPPPAELARQLMREPGLPNPTASERLLWWEGKAMDALESAALVGGSKGAIAARLARQIGERISRRFPDGVDGLLCPDCVTRFREHKARLSPVEAVTYCACRSCKQSKKAIEHSGEVVAVLDADDDRPMLRKGESLRVNWLARARKKAFEGQDVFDFDRVEVACASDEEVRHFLVDVTSDTDPARRKRYRAMECRIGPRCDLSENTLLALRKVFGAVTTSRAANRP